MAFGLERLFFKKRLLYLGGGLFFLLGALVVGYFSFFTPGNFKEVQNHRVVEAKAHKKALKMPGIVTGGRAKVRAYAFTTPGTAPKVQVSAATNLPGSRSASALVLKKASTDASIGESKAQPPEAPLTLPITEPGAHSALVIVIDDLGVDQTQTKKVIELAGPLTLAFLPYGYNLETLTAKAIEKKHELLVHLPMQPQALDADPGPNALLRTLSETEIRSRIDWNLSQFAGFVGINNHMGSNFTTWEYGMSFIMQEMKKRGLLYLDSLTSPKSVAKKVAREYGLSVFSRDIFLDNEPELDQIRQRLSELEEISRRRGYAIGIGHPYEKTIKVLSEWSKNLNNRGFRLVSLSNLSTN